MKSGTKSLLSAALVLVSAMTCVPMNAAETSDATVPVRMTVTASVASDKRMPEIGLQDILVTQGKQQLKVSEWIPAKAENAFRNLDFGANFRLAGKSCLNKFPCPNPCNKHFA